MRIKIATTKEKRNLINEFSKRLNYFFDANFIEMEFLSTLSKRQVYSLLKRTSIKKELAITKKQLKIMALFLSQTKLQNLSTNEVKMIYNQMFFTNLFELFSLAINEFKHNLLDKLASSINIVFSYIKKLFYIQENSQELYCIFTE